MSRRGAELREHILYSAKSVFLEVGFERASMDMIADRAKTSKRTLYSHFESKENLYLAIIELLREIYLSRVKSPAHYAEDPHEALVQFLAAYQQGLLFVWTIKMCRMIAIEADRFPEGSRRYFDVIFNTPFELIRDFVGDRWDVTEEQSAEIANSLMSQIIHPGFIRVLFGIDPVIEMAEVESSIDTARLEPIRQNVQNHLGAQRLST